MSECFIYQKDEDTVMAKNALIPLLGLVGIAALTINQLDSTNTKTVTMPFNYLGKKSPSQQRVEELEKELGEQTDGQTASTKYLPELKWLPNELQGQKFRKMLNGEVNEEWNPFIRNITDYGPIGMTKWSGGAGVGTLTLVDDDCASCYLGCCDISGWLQLSVKANYRIILEIRTENHNYFHDAVTNSSGQTLAEFVIAQGREEENTWGWNSTSSVRVVLYGKNEYQDSPDGDFLHVDIDNEGKSGVAEFQIRTNGELFTTEENPDDEVTIQLVDVAYLNPDYDSTLTSSAEWISFNASKLSLIKRFKIGVGKRLLALRNITKGKGAVSGTGKSVAFTKLDGLPVRGMDVAIEGTEEVVEIIQIGGTVSKASKAGELPIADEAFVGGAKGVKNVGGSVETTLKPGWAVVRGADNSVQIGKVTLSKGDTIVKLSKMDDVSGFGKIFGGQSIGGAAKNVAIGSVYVVGAGVAYVAYSVAKMLPDQVGDVINDFGCSITGDCCEESCAEAENPDCVKECKDAAQEKSLLIGGLAVAGLLGLVVILKGKGNKKSAEEYIIVQTR